MTDTITTQRLVLRRFSDADAPVIAAVMQHSEVVEKLLWVPSPYGEDDAHAFITDIAQPDPGTFAIEQNGTLIGSISVGARLGYWIAPEAWGQGFAQEAARAVLDWHFAQSDAPVAAGIVEDNPKSHRVLEKLGFRDGETRQEYSAALGRDVSFHDMTLTADMWREAA
jgi:RimJ/RimL family protein N-acetyltransferase